MPATVFMAWRRSSLRSGRKGYFGPFFLRSTLDAVDALDRLGRERRGAAEEEERELHGVSATGIGAD